MKFIKLSLLVLPLVVMADTPALPADIDSAEPSSDSTSSQVESLSLDTQSYETSSSYTSDENGVEEVVVTGIKRSLMDAISIKRSNTGIVDAITAEDFGKFPDNNLAESLARVVGIGIDRSNVEGERVAVRGFGPEYNLVTLNGRQMPTAPNQWDGGRSFNFGDISSLGISAVEVYKSSNSTLPSGGIGSTINMVTTKPLSIPGQLTSFSVDYLLDSTNPDDELQPEMNFVHSSNFGRWGIAVSGSFQDRTNREIGSRETNWMTFPDQQTADGYLRITDSQATVNNNRRADGKTFFQEPSAYQFKDNDRERTNAQVALQYEFSDRLVGTLDYTYSEVDFASTGQMFGSWLGAWNTLGGTINERGVWTDVIVSDRGYDHQYIYGSTVNENASTGLNLEFTVSDALVLELDYHDSTAERIGTELPNEIGLGAPSRATVTHTSSSSGVYLFDYDQDFYPDEYNIGGVYVRDAYKSNDMEQLQLKGEWQNLDGAFLNSFITSIEFGISMVDSIYQDNRAEETPSPSPLPGTDSSVPASLMKAMSMNGFFDGFSWNTAQAVDYYYEIQPGIVDFASTLVSLDAGSWDTLNTVDEEFESAWLQVNMEFSLNDKPLNVVLGLRNEKTDRTSTGLELSPTALAWSFNSIQYDYAAEMKPSSRSGVSEILLPSLAVAYEIADDRVVRFSYSESMARTGLQNLTSALTYGSRGYTQPTVSGGNPDLEPLTSENFDLSYEWYYAEGSYLAINYFRKEIDNFEDAGEFDLGNLYGLTNPALGPRADAARACVQAWVDAGSPVGGDGGNWWNQGFFNAPVPTDNCVNDRLRYAQGWMGVNELAAVAAANQNAFEQGTLYEWWGEGYWNVEYAYGAGPINNGFSCYGGFWYCDHANIRGNADDPLATFTLNTTVNKRSGTVSGWEIALQHLFGETGFGLQFNATLIDGGDTDIDRNAIGRQFLLDGLGNSGNFSAFYEDDKITARVALNNRGETVAGFGAFDQPLYVEERNQIDASFAYRLNDQASVFVDFQNLTDETTRLHARHKEMLFLAQDHGVISRIGFRYKF